MPGIYGDIRGYMGIYATHVERGREKVIWGIDTCNLTGIYGDICREREREGNMGVQVTLVGYMGIYATHVERGREKVTWGYM
jgi:hypothetical protein